MKTVTYQQVKELAAQLAGRADDTLGSGLKLSVSEALMLRTFFAAELPDLWQREAWPETCDHGQAFTLDANKCFANPYQDTSSLTVTGAGLTTANGVYVWDGAAYQQTPQVEGLPAYIAQAGADWQLNVNGTIYSITAATPIGTWTDLDDYPPAPTSAYTTAPVALGDILTVLTGNPMASNKVTRLEWTELLDRVNVLTNLASVWVDWQTAPPDLLDDAVVGADINTYELPARFKLPMAARGAALLLADEDPARAGALRALAEGDLIKQASRLKLPWWRKL